ncbi:MAG: hypothetical protein GDA36_03745 [Rhodobacteraceae bacterium]|nr:hypothetical protein [Paracoccaceae bacterium]
MTDLNRKIADAGQHLQDCIWDGMTAREFIAQVDPAAPVAPDTPLHRFVCELREWAEANGRFAQGDQAPSALTLAVWAADDRA